MSEGLKISSLLALFCFPCCSGDAQAPDYAARIRYLYDGINTRLQDQKTGLYLETTDSIENLPSLSRTR